MMDEPIGGPLPGEWAIVEILGHSTLIGRIAEVDRFGTKFLAIEPLFAGALLPVVYQGGTSIYRLTPCSFDVAWQKQATRSYQLPPAVAAIVPPLMLTKEAAPTVTHMVDVFDDVEDPREEMPF